MITTISEFQQQINELNLDRHERKLLTLVKSCLYIERKPINDPDTLPPGASRLGGNPDLPAGFAWIHANDKPLTFIAQFRLSEIAPHDIDNILPTRGLLYFFYAADSQPWGSYEDRDGWSIVYIADENTPLVRTPHPSAEGKYTRIEALPLHSVSFLSGLSLPILQYGDSSYYGLEMDDDEKEAYYTLIDRFTDDLPAAHQIFGYPIPIQYYVEWECVLSSLPDDRRQQLRDRLKADKGTLHHEKMREWQFLFQIDTDDDLKVMWGDVGMLYVCIPKTSLKQRRFENCWTVLQCS